MPTWVDSMPVGDQFPPSPPPSPTSGKGPGHDNLYSERIAGSARILLGPATVDGELKYDLATKTTNLARVRLSAPLGSRVSGEASSSGSTCPSSSFGQSGERSPR